MRNFLLLSLLALGFFGTAQDDCLFQADIAIYTELWGDEVSWDILDEDGVVVASGNGYESNSSAVQTACLEDSCYTLEMHDSFGDGWNGATISINYAALGIMVGPLTLEQGSFAAFSVGFSPSCGGNLIDSDGEGNGGGNTDIWGCMDTLALNFDPSANADCCCQYPIDCSASNTLEIIQASTGDSFWGFGEFYAMGEDGVYWYPSSNEIDDAGQWIQGGCIEDGCYNLTIHPNNFFGLETTLEVFLNGVLQETIVIPADLAVYETSLGINTDGCTLFVLGCTDPEAPNYNPAATDDNGSCLEPCDCPDVYDPVCGYDYYSGQTLTFSNICELECAGAYFQWEGDCSEPPVYGCTDPEGLNYDPNATAESGCLYMPECGEDHLISIYSVNNPLDSLELGWFSPVSTYFTNATGYINTFVGLYDENGYASYGCLSDGCYNFYLVSNGWGGGSAEVSIDGEAPITYTIEDDAFEAVYAFGVNETDCEISILGCTDPEATNYNPLATADDGSCVVPFTCDEGVAGQLYVCTFSQGNEVALTITDSQGEVLYSQEGYPDLTIDFIDVCLDPEECYIATMSNIAGGDSWNGGYFWITANNTEWVNGSLEGSNALDIEFGLADDCGEDISGGNDPIWGCTDPFALNYDALATYDDGSCFYDNVDTSFVDCGDLNTVTGLFFQGSDPFIDEVSWALLDSTGNAVLIGQGNNLGPDGTLSGYTACLEDGCYTLELYDSFGDGWGGGLLILTSGNSALTFTLDEGEFASFPFEVGAGCGEILTIWGCTDPGATNFNAEADAEDGSCEYASCPLIEVTFVTYTMTDGAAVSWTMEGMDDTTGDSTWVSSSAMGDFGVHTHTTCMASGCYSMTLHDAGNDGWNQGWLEVWMDGDLMTTATFDPNGDNTMSLGIGTDCGDAPGVTSGNTNFGMSGWDDTVDFSIYPTPTGEIVNILGEGFDNEAPVVVRIKDMMGKLIAEKTVMPQDGPAAWVFDVSGWPAGIYTAEGTQGSKTATGKVMVAR